MINALDQTSTASKPIINGSIDADTASASTLSLVFFKTQLVFLVENQRAEIIMYGQVPIDHFNITEAGIKELHDLEFFNFRYRKVWAAVSNNQYCMVPSALHRKEHNMEYLAFCIGTSGHHKFSCIKQDNLFMLDLVVVYNMIYELEKFLLSKHPGISIRHEKSVLASKGLDLSRDIGDIILINLCHDHFDILVTQKGKMIFMNSFPMHNTEEILYYIFDVLKQQNLNMADFQLRMCGLNPPFINIDLLLKYLPSLENKITPENLPAHLSEAASYFTAYHLIR